LLALHFSHQKQKKTLSLISNHKDANFKFEFRIFDIGIDFSIDTMHLTFE